MELAEILHEFIENTNDLEISQFGDGLIHSSYLVTQNNHPVFVLQELNTTVFTNPLMISENLEFLSNYLNSNNIDPFFPLPLRSLSNQPYVLYKEKCYRLSKYVNNSHSINACTKPEEAYEAAFQFGKFTSAFSEFDQNLLKETIPQFHDLSFRWKQFEVALKNGNQKRISFAHEEINEIREHYFVVDKFQKIRTGNSFSKRVTHHDTKISNVLFDPNSKGICVIDLDTVMSGYFISDLGDMFRTYLSPANEEVQDLDQVTVRRDYFEAIVEGYLDRMKDHMSADELQNINYAGEFMIFMQALRFMTDFINNDKYYGISYELNNFARAQNQLRLLKEFSRIS